jgi:DNA-nicking Smr family endonuclease
MKKPSKKLNKSKAPNDDGLWQHVTEQVAPLKGREALYVDMPDEVTESKTSQKPRSIRKRKASPKIETRVVHKSPPLILTHVDQPGMDKRNQQRMRQGKLALDARTDLHGMTRAQAHRVLAGFIEESWQADKRMVLVITGKGLRPDGTMGVLRTAVPRWLNESPNRERILGFSYAAPKDGGEGALYVRLKKSSKKRI